MQSNYEPSRVLMDCHVAGFAYHEGLSVVDELRLGVKVELRFEPNNPYDPEAVAIYFSDTKIGYVPREKNSGIFQLLYFGHDDLFETCISMVDDNAHPERRFRITVKIADKM